MKLYEFTNGFMGFAAIQAFCWAPDEPTARAMATEQFKRDGQAKIIGDAFWSDLQCRLLFVDTADPFCTKSDDGGWQEDWKTDDET